MSTFAGNPVIGVVKRRFPHPKSERVMQNPVAVFLCSGLGFPFPDLPFLVFFVEKTQGKPPKIQGFCISSEPLKSLEKKGKTVKKMRNFLVFFFFQAEKEEENPKKQGKEDHRVT